MEARTIIITCDHAGFEAKKNLYDFLVAKDGIEVLDVGPQELDPEDDYPITIAPMCKLMQEMMGDKKHVIGIAVARSGQGEAMIANRFKNIRALVVNNNNDEVVTLGRQHNNANVISLASQFLSDEEMKHAVDLFLQTPFSGEERHARRIALIENPDLYE